MSEIWNMRIQNKHDAEGQWNSFVPLEGELVVIDPSSATVLPVLKVGVKVPATATVATLSGVAAEGVVINPGSVQKKQYKIRTASTFDATTADGYITFITY